MFKSVGTAVKKKESYFKKITERSLMTNEALNEFAEIFFPQEKIFLIKEITLSVSGDSLIIHSSNKTIANELLMKSKELVAIFKSKIILFNKVIIK